MKKRQITPKDGEVIAMVIKIVSSYYNTEDIFKTKSRIKKIAESRQVSLLFIKELLPDISLVTIGKQCGGLDHSSIIYSIRAIKNLSVFDTRIKNDLAEIKKLIEEYDTMPMKDNDKTPMEKDAQLIILAKKMWDDLYVEKNCPYTEFDSYYNSLFDENGKFVFEITSDTNS